MLKRFKKKKNFDPILFHLSGFETEKCGKKENSDKG